LKERLETRKETIFSDREKQETKKETKVSLVE